MHYTYHTILSARNEWVFFALVVCFCRYRHIKRSPWLYAGGNNLIDRIFRLRFRQPMKLLVDFPLVEQSAKWHEPNFALRPSQQGHSIEDQSGKQLSVACPTDTFFEGSSSLSTSRFVPLTIASMIAAL